MTTHKVAEDEAMKLLKLVLRILISKHLTTNTKTNIRSPVLVLLRNTLPTFPRRKIVPKMIHTLPDHHNKSSMTAQNSYYYVNGSFYSLLLWLSLGLLDIISTHNWWFSILRRLETRRARSFEDATLKYRTSNLPNILEKPNSNMYLYMSIRRFHFDVNGKCQIGRSGWAYLE